VQRELKRAAAFALRQLANTRFYWEKMRAKMRQKFEKIVLAQSLHSGYYSRTP